MLCMQHKYARCQSSSLIEFALHLYRQLGLILRLKSEHRGLQDLSGRPHLSFDCDIPTERIGNFDTQLVEHFFSSLATTGGITLHIRKLAGRNSHHIVEATFKAFARALRVACEIDPRRRGQIASSKGVLTQQ